MTSTTGFRMPCFFWDRVLGWFGCRTGVVDVLLPSLGVLLLAYILVQRQRAEDVWFSSYRRGFAAGVLLLVFPLFLPFGSYFVSTGASPNYPNKLDARMEVADLQCRDARKHDEIVIWLRNEGNTVVNSSSVDVTVYAQSTVNMTFHGKDWSGKAFIEPGGLDIVHLNVSAADAGSRFLESNRTYRIKANFTTPYKSDLTVEGRGCIAITNS